MRTSKKKIRFTPAAIDRIPLSKAGRRRVYWDTGCPNLGLSVGKLKRSYFFQCTVAGTKKQVRLALGNHGHLGPNGVWSADLARERATELRKQCHAGIDPRATTKAADKMRITWRQGMAAHRKSLELRGKAASTIASFADASPMGVALGEFLDRPVVSLMGSDVVRIYEAILSKPKQHGAVNEGGVASGYRLINQIKAVRTCVHNENDGLPGLCPTKAVTPKKIKAKLLRIPDHGFEVWFSAISGLSALRRDLNLFVLFSALRSGSACALTWSDVDRENRILNVPVMKGGKQGFRLPLTDTLLALLDRRKAANAIDFPEGDGGLIFATRGRGGRGPVRPLRNPSERVTVDGVKRRHPVILGLHALRCTYNTIAAELGVLLEDRERLLGHSSGKINDTSYVADPSLDRLRGVAQGIEAALLSRLGVSLIVEGRPVLKLVG